SFGRSLIQSFIHSFTDSHFFSYGIVLSLLSDLSPSSFLSLPHPLSLSPSVYLPLTLSLPFISPPTSQCSVSVLLCLSLSFSLSVCLLLSLFLVCSSSSLVCCLSALPVSFLCGPEPPAEPGTPAHSTAGKTPACFTTTQKRLME
ncbi:hypothetical protein PO909_001947, partial [Leuciscus waleckii]